MNRRQQLLILMLLSKLSMIGTLYFGFWAFIYQYAWHSYPLWFSLMSSGVSLIFSLICLCGWIVFDMWIRDPSTMPIFKIERKPKVQKTKGKTAEEPEEQTEDESRLPLY